MKYDDLAQQIVQNVGGKENVMVCWHCVTRLRFTTKDKNKVNIDKIKNLKGVMGHNGQTISSKLLSGIL